MSVAMVTMMLGSGKCRGGKHHHQQGSGDDFLHGLTLASLETQPHPPKVENGTNAPRQETLIDLALAVSLNFPEA